MGRHPTIVSLLLVASVAGCGGVRSTDGDDDGDDGDDGGGTADDDGGGETLVIESISPAPGATDVARTEPLVITFSQSIDPSTVSGDTVQVVTAAGPVVGSFEVAGDRVTFTPQVQWHLLGSVQVVVAEAAAVSGATLTEAGETTFTIEDGQWREPIPIASGVACCASAAGNRRGDIVFPFETLDQSVSAVTFDPISQSFAPAVSLEEADRVFDGPIAALDQEGDAIVAWHGELNVMPEVIGWRRFEGGAWTAGDVQQVDNLINNIALADDGTALAVWREGNADVMSTRLTGGAETWTAPAVLEPASFSWGVYGVGGRVQVIVERADSGGLFSRTLDPDSGEFSPPSSIGAEGAMVNYVNHASLEDGGALFSWWQPDDDEIHFGRYSGRSDAWTPGRLGDGQGGSQVCENRSGARIGTFRDGGTVLAARAAPGEAFGLAEDLGSQTGLDFAGCFMDAFGHGHGLWAGYGTDRIFWARHRADGTWDDAIEVLTASALRGWFADAYGNLTIIYVDGTDAFARRFR